MARRSRLGYVSDIEECLEALHSGDSYELCYTTKLKYLGPVDAMLLYLALRASNPAMHAAWLNFGPDIPKVRVSLTPPYHISMQGIGRVLHCKRRSCQACQGDLAV